MKIKLTFFASILLCFAYFSLQAQTPSPLQQEAMALNAMLQKYHYSPKTLDDALSRKVFVACFQTVDPKGMLFTQADIRAFAKYETTIDDDILGKKWTFVPAFTALYLQKVKSQQVLATEILSQSFDFTQADVMEIQPDSIENTPKFVADENALKQKLYLHLKYLTLRKMVTQAKKEATDEAILATEGQVRAQILKRIEHRIDRILHPAKGIENEMATTFFRAFTYCFDPHTMYLSKADREWYEKGVSRDNQTFGLVLTENDKEEIVIEKLSPGGPAWNSGKLNEGDVILEIQPTNKGKIDATEAELYEIYTLFEDSDIRQISLIVRKSDGRQERISLTKIRMTEDENVVKSLIFTGKKKIGYISLPSFYTDMRMQGSLGCANDVAKEIVKLKKEGIEGLIFDIRFNGGGAFHEGLDLAGIFINEGSLAVTRGREGKGKLRLDPNRGTMWDGPLLVMINGQSASASEVLATTLKDYNRALIVGSPSFGKATSQVMMPLDSISPDKWGFLLVTIEKIYRVNRKSIQAIGLAPDIYLPEATNFGIEKEGLYKYVLPNDTVAKEVRFTPLVPLPIASLAAKSKKRVEVSPGFELINTLAKTNEEQDLITALSLNFAQYRQYRQSAEATYKRISTELDAYKNKLQIQNTTFDKALNAQNTARAQINTEYIDNIQSDAQIEECYQIMVDWLSGGQ